MGRGAILSGFRWSENHLAGQVRRAERDRCERPGLTTDRRAEFKRLHREIVELRRANEIPKEESAFLPGRSLAPERSDGALHRPAPGAVWSRVDLRGVADHSVHPFPPPSAAVTKRSARARHDEDLLAAIQRIWNENVCGPRKAWRQLCREGIPTARRTVEWLMRALDLCGTVPSRT